jgi:hypothetical protein
MAGKRMLHSNICESEKLALISYEAETLYYRLLTRVDDNGNFSADPRVVYGQCLTLREDMTPKKVTSLLNELSSVTGRDKKPLIEFYESDGDRYLHITKFEDFQYLRKDRPSTITCPVHPNFMGPQVGNQWLTSDQPEVTHPHGKDKLSKEKLREVKLKEEESAQPSFGHEWKRLAIRFREVLGKFVSSTKTNKKQYSDFCGRYGEDLVLSVFNEWAAQNKSWLRDKDDPLFFFWRSLPENVEATSSEREAEKSDQVDAGRVQVDLAVRTQAIDAELQKITEQKAWDEAHKDEI